jgi:cytidine deaminase
MKQKIWDELLCATLIQDAMKARLKAYAPYSNFKVGAALIAGNGRIYTGANIENCVYRGTHAERSALDNAMADGQRSILAIAVVGDAPNPLYPCGQCLQDLAELDHNKRGDLIVIPANIQGKCEITTLADLFPIRFTPSDLGIDPRKF